MDIPEIKAKAGDIISLTENKAAEFSAQQLQLYHVAYRNGLVGKDGKPVAQERAPPLYTGTSIKDWDKRMQARKDAINKKKVN
jgi:hypothetical protein